jgi:acyl-CoA synthetase (NDP forming)
MPEIGRAHALARLLRPQSAAVVGASPTSRYGARLLNNLRRRPWNGRLYGVNPRYAEVDGVPCFPHLRAVPEAVDLVVVATPAGAVPEVLAEAADVGAGGAIVLAADVDARYAETVASLWRERGLAVLGPNCLGYVSAADRLTAAWSIGLPEAPWVGSGAAVVSQSGNLANHLLNCPLGQDFSYVISCGNQWGVTVPEFVEWLARESEVTVVGCIVEGLPDPAAFLEAADAVRRAGKALVVLHLGRSDLGRHMAAAHTGALALGDEWWQAARRRVPFATASDLEDFVGLLKLADRVGFRSRLDVGFAASSGGECGLIADLSADFGLPLPALAPQTVERLAQVLPAYVHPANPLDYGANTWGTVEPYRSAVTAMAADPAVDLLGVVQDFPGDPAHVGPWETMLEGAAAARQATGKPVLVVTALGSVPSEYFGRAKALGVDIFPGLRPTIAALAEWRRLGRAVARPAASGRAGAPRPAGPRLHSGPWNEAEAKAALAAWGVAVPRGRTARDLDEAVAAADALGYPVVVKGLGIAHKSDVGAVVVNVGSADAVRKAVTAMAERVAAHGLTVDGWLVEEYLGGRLEWFVGGSSQPGLVLTGRGGIEVEVWRDVAAILPGASAEEVAAALREVRAYRLLEGFREAAGYDVAALVDTIRRVAAFLDAHRDRALALDVNPVLVGRPGQGCVAADVLLVEGGPSGPGGPAGEGDAHE